MMENNGIKKRMEVIQGHRKERMMSNISWVIVLLWMLFIFFISSQPEFGSNEFSDEITGRITGILDDISPGMTLSRIIFHERMRKPAHFMAYFVLGILVVNALMKSKKNGFCCFFWTMAICSMYAAGDGFYRYILYIGEGSINEIILNISGAFSGSFLLLILLEEIKMFESGELFKNPID